MFDFKQLLVDNGIIVQCNEGPIYNVVLSGNEPIHMYVYGMQFCFMSRTLLPPHLHFFSRYCLPFFSFSIESFTNETGFVLVPYQNIIVKYFNNWFKLDIFRLLQLVTGNFQSHLKCLIWTIDRQSKPNARHVLGVQELFWMVFS